MTDLRGIIFHTYGETEEVLYDWLVNVTGIKWERGFPVTYKPGPKVNKPVNTGCTGSDLEDKMVDLLELYKIKFSGFEMVLLEDDLDYRPWEKVTIQNTIEERAAHIKEWMKNQYNDLTPKVKQAYSSDIDLVLMYASPEVESWMVADWQNGMGKLCSDSMFCTAVNQVLQDKLALYYDENIELWHYHPSKRIKFSKLIEEIIFDLQMLMEDAEGNIPFKEIFPINERERIDGSKFEYKKTIHGKSMLKAIDPDKVYEKCHYFFGHAIDKIREIYMRK